ncbi:hypothetical protein CBS9595_003658 [Malassezia furfur]|nr:hypothetical protein CBS9595_003658 [Malassezia furfur]
MTVGDLDGARACASRAVQHELEGAYAEALKLYTSAAQAYLDLLRIPTKVQTADAEQHKRLASRLLSRAERLKRALRHPLGPRIALSAHEEQNWPLWPYSGAPLSNPALSTLQVEQGATYGRSALPVFRPEVRVRGGDIRQGAVTDCSFVAALEVAAEYDARWHTQLAHGALHPRQDGDPCQSTEGVYAVSLFVDGARRCITINDELPMDARGNLVCASTCEAPQLWPALLEKAFLVAHGSSYAFHGSDAAADLYMLTGWIPEHITLHAPGFQREKTWQRLLQAWQQGTCLLSLGTGAVVDATVSDALRTFIPLHCYAILSLDERNGERVVTLVNPWKTQGAPAPFVVDDTPAVLTCAWEEVCALFDTIAVNWNPAEFEHTDAAHASWDWSADAGVCPDHVEAAVSDQYHLELPPGAQELLVHLERHRLYDARETPEYIAVHAFHTNAQRKLAQVEHGGEMGVYVDGRHTLLRLSAQADEAHYTLAVSLHGSSMRPFPLYSLRVFSRDPFTLERMPAMLAHRAQLLGAWQGEGGHALSARFRHNPQYAIMVHSLPGSLPQLVVRVTTQAQLPVQLALVRGKQRITYLGPPTLITSSGPYTRGLALSEIPAVQPGEYTLILSTLAPVQAQFALTVECSAPIDVERLPAEGAGMYHRAVVSDTRWELVLERSMSVELVVSSDEPESLHVSVYDAHTALASAAPVSPMSTCVTLHMRMLPAGTYTVLASPPGTRRTLDVYSAQPLALHPS